MSRYNIETAKSAGFCFGVKRAVEIAEKTAEENGSCYTLGELIHNGSEIGTVVLPNATVKIYLTADAEVRAKRRYDELIAKGTAVSYESVLTDLKQRDHNDMTREIAPLKQADDAVLADTTELDFEGSCDLLVRIIKEKAEIR